MPGREPKDRQTAMRLTRKAYLLLARLEKHYGLSRTAVIELLVRDTARALSLDYPEKPGELAD